MGVLELEPEGVLHIVRGQRTALEFTVRVLLGEGVVVEILLADIVDVGDHVVEFIANGFLQCRDLIG